MASGKGVFLAAIALATGIALSGCNPAPESSKAPREQARTAPAASKEATPFSLRTFDGKQLELKDLRGRPVVLNFFASWCGPCQAEAPGLREASSELGDRVVFVGVAIDDTEEEARAFIRQFDIKFPAGLDSTGDITKAYNIFAIPRTYFIDKNGVVLHEHSGAMMREEIDAAIKLVL